MKTKSCNKVFFYPAYNEFTGSGHLNRLIAFAEQLDNDKEIEFIFNSNVPKNFPYNHKLIKSDLTLNQEIKAILSIIDCSFSTLILDGYSFNKEYLRMLKEMRQDLFLVYVDDFAGTIQYADVIINHSPGVKPTDYEVPSKTKLFLGLSYLMIRKEFLNDNEEQNSVNKGSVFICLGGVDDNNATNKVVETLNDIDRVNLITVVLGSAYKHKSPLLNNAKVRAYTNLSAKEMKEKMKESELLLLPSSTLSLEGFALQKKMIILKTSVDQAYVYQGLSEKNKIESLDVLREFNPIELKKLVIKQLDITDLQSNKMMLKNKLKETILV